MYESNYYMSIDSQNNRFCEVIEFVLLSYALWNFPLVNKLWPIEWINIWNLWIKRFLTIADSTIKRYILIFSRLSQKWLNKNKNNKRRSKCGARIRTREMEMGLWGLEVILRNWRQRSIRGTHGSAPPPSLARIQNLGALFNIVLKPR